MAKQKLASLKLYVERQWANPYWSEEVTWKRFYVKMCIQFRKYDGWRWRQSCLVMITTNWWRLHIYMHRHTYWHRNKVLGYGRYNSSDTVIMIVSIFLFIFHQKLFIFFIKFYFGVDFRIYIACVQCTLYSVHRRYSEI